MNEDQRQEIHMLRNDLHVANGKLQVAMKRWEQFLLSLEVMVLKMHEQHRTELTYWANQLASEIAKYRGTR
jgi:hypothetical protein